MSTAAFPPARVRAGGPPVARPVRFPLPVRDGAETGLLRAWRRLRRGLLERRGETARGKPVPAVPSAVSPGLDDIREEPRIRALYQYRRLDLVRLALLLVDDLPTAEDVVQDAFAAVFRRHGATLAGLDDPEAYLRTSVVNTARSVLRRRRTARAHVLEREEHVPPPEDHVLLGEEHGQVIDALHHLTRRQREVLVLRYWSNLTEAQIADTLGLSNGTVKSTASRALAALRRHLEARDDAIRP